MNPSNLAPNLVLYHSIRRVWGLKVYMFPREDATGVREGDIWRLIVSDCYNSRSFAAVLSLESSNVFSFRVMASNSFSFSHSRIYCFHHRPWLTWVRSSLHTGFLISIQSFIPLFIHSLIHLFISLHLVCLRCQTLCKKLRINWWNDSLVFFVVYGLEDSETSVGNDNMI